MAKHNTDWDDYISYGIDVRNRRVFFGLPLMGVEDAGDSNGFLQLSIEVAVRGIKYMETLNPKTPIEIHMNSYGGDPYSMMYLVDVMLASTCKFIFYGGGAIMSCATWIMAVSDERWLYPNARILLHNGGEGVPDQTYDDFHIYAKESKRLMNDLIDIYVENSRMPKSFWQDICKRDAYLSAQETIMLGLADFIVKPVKRGNLRKKRANQLAKTPDLKALSELTKRIYKRVEVNPSNEDIVINVTKDEEDPEITVENLDNGSPEELKKVINPNLSKE
jgi:ATP-dependent Clp protease protease subunit